MECKKCGPGCTCGPECTCPSECKGNCAPKKCGGPCPPKPFCPIARVLEPAPYFEGQVWFDGMIQNVKLTDYKDKWVVLFFYPFDFTFVCPTEIFQMLLIILLKLTANLLEPHAILYSFIENLL